MQLNRMSDNNFGSRFRTDLNENWNVLEQMVNQLLAPVESENIAPEAVTDSKLVKTLINRITKGHTVVIGKLYYRILNKDTIEILAPKYSLGFFSGGGEFKYINTITENVILNKYESLVYDTTNGITYVEKRTLTGTTIDKGAFAADDKLLLVSHITYDRIISNLPIVEVEDDENNIVFAKTPTAFTVYAKSTGAKYIGYSFRLTEKPYIAGDKTSNVKVWSYKKSAEYKKNIKFNYEIIREFYTSATQDLMIRENGVTDYMGGEAHGDEVLQSVRMFVDDREINPNASINLVGREVKLLQTTFLYRDTQYTNGQLIHVATARKVHVINKSGYSIDVSVEFHKDISLRECHMGALSMNRKDSGGNYIFKEAIFGRYLTSEDLTTTATEFNKYQDVEDIFIIGNDISVNWRTKRKENISGNKTWINNSTDTLTKIYSSYIPNDYAVKVGEVFQQKTHYLFDSAK
ncbi:hypothetical protein CN272_11365 [Bacillus anthracis]|nr:hypothetical protein CN272_11365 [Bacillus anthracis]